MTGGSGGSFVSSSPLPLHPLKTLRENGPAGNGVDLSREGCEHLALVYPKAPARPQIVPSCRAAFVVPVRDEDACAGGTEPDFVSHPRGVSNQNTPCAASIPQVAAARPSLQAAGEGRLSAVTPGQSPCSLWPGSPVSCWGAVRMLKPGRGHFLATELARSEKWAPQVHFSEGTPKRVLKLSQLVVTHAIHIYKSLICKLAPLEIDRETISIARYDMQ
uniref:Uncharacterized protein n=1 Tax=Myotis myotis TaxID=51298 RepID=A0A7J7ZXZ8_MYOMY|nr:hypothetical protein mMyoMyo1_010002 [Myotis myotis]